MVLILGVFVSISCKNVDDSLLVILIFLNGIDRSADVISSMVDRGLLLILEVFADAAGN
jgi:hypothetical protein